MSKFTLKFDTLNSAFDYGNKEAEMARILRKIADLIEADGCPKLPTNIRDVNGNVIGNYSEK